MFRAHRAVVLASAMFLSQLGVIVMFEDVAFAQTAPAVEATTASAPKVIGADDSGISSATESGVSNDAPVTFYPDRYPPPEARWKTLGLGAGLVALGYGLAIGTSYLWDGAPGMQTLRTPVIGPIGAIGESRCGEDEGIGCSTVTVVLRAVLAGVAGLAQVGGIGVLTEGVLMKTQEPPPVAAKPQWYALPTASKSGAGVSVGLTF